MRGDRLLFTPVICCLQPQRTSRPPWICHLLTISQFIGLVQARHFLVAFGTSGARQRMTLAIGIHSSFQKVNGGSTADTRSFWDQLRF